MPDILIKSNKNKRGALTGKYEVHFSYDKEIIEAVKALPLKQRKYEANESRYWVVSIEGLNTLSGKAVFKNKDVAMEQDAAESYKKWLEQRQAIAQVKASLREQIMERLDLNSPLPSGRGLMPHQKEDVAWALDALKDETLDGVILALDMGLGKTFISLFLARLYNQVSGCDIIVICPASLIQNWQKEAILAGVEVSVFSWNKTPKTWDKPFVLVADEAHYAQAGEKSLRGKALIDLSRHHNMIKSFLLTGTPMKNGRPRELYPLLHVVHHPITFDQTHYDKFFCNGKMKKITKRGKGGLEEFNFWDNSGAKNLDVLHQEVKNVLRYRKKADCIDLPEKIRLFRPVEVEKDALAAYKLAYKDAQNEYQQKKEDLDQSAALTLLMRLRQAGSLAKVNSVIEVAEELLSQGRPVVIFTEFIETVELLHAALGGEVLTGATKIEDRQGCVDRFQSGESNVFIGTSRAAGVGLTLTRASDVILCDRPWSPGDAQQAEDRVHRIGQGRTVMSFWIQFGETDTKVDDMLATKFERISLALEGKRKTMRGIPSKEKIALAVCKSLFEKKSKEFEEMMREVEEAIEVEAIAS
jgi:SNF2 family DNA or RNA helicase